MESQPGQGEAGHQLVSEGIPLKTLLFITDRNVLNPTGERRLILDRAQVLYEEYQVLTHMVVLRPQFRSKQAQLTEDLPFVKVDERVYSNPLGFMRIAWDLLAMARRPDVTGVVLSGHVVLSLAGFMRRAGMPVTIDVHGDVAEWKEHPPRFLRQNRLLGSVISVPIRWVTNWAIRTAGGAFVVSTTLEDQVRRAGVERVYRVPCCVPSWPSKETWSRNRREFRSSLGIPEDAMVWMYSGGLDGWQMIDETLEFFARVASVSSRSRFIIATPRAEEVREKLIANDLADGRFLAVSLHPEDVLPALCAADVGMLLRAESATNRAAFPNKFTEYLAAGLYVVVGKGAADPAMIAKETGVGAVVMPRDLETATHEEIAEFIETAMATREVRWNASREVLDSLVMTTTLKPFVADTL